MISINFCRTVQGGVETVVVLENGVLTSKTVNGEPVAIEGSKEPVGSLEDNNKSKKKKGKH